jgi:alkylation response protein AidB-like acyl-CoA dehydrogenase
MDGSNVSTNTDAAEVLDMTMDVSPTNCYVADAQRESMSPQQFTATYDQARDFIREAGRSSVAVMLPERTIYADTFLGVTVEDITRVSDRFWAFYLGGMLHRCCPLFSSGTFLTHLISGRCTVDLAACTIVSIHQNLCMGSIAPHVKRQPHLKGLIQQLERFESCGDFMLTEFGHGLDARHIETTATLSPDGTYFDLHSPSLDSAKSMPPVTPLGGLPKVAVVFAQLVVDGAMHGVRTFVVDLTDGVHMRPGISTALLPQRPGCRPLDHAVTSFHHVRLTRDSLLGEINNAEDKRLSFFREIHRVSVGGLALSLVNVPALKAGAYLAYTFSQQRTVISPITQQPVPVLSFPTQYGPIISAAAHASVMEAAGRHIIHVFQQPGTPPALRQALVGIFKAIATYATQRHFSELTDRCGWRGLFSFNKISELQLALKGNSIAEGDVMVLCVSMWKANEHISARRLLLTLPRTRLRTATGEISASTFR